MLQTFSFIANHPLARADLLNAFWRFAEWQLISRTAGSAVVPWVGDAKLALRRKMVGATGNRYCGLHEYADMSFVLHFLRPGDLFLDVGANVGSYTVLASKVCDATTVAFEPGEALPHLRRNIEVNGIGERVTVHDAAVGDRVGFAGFTRGLDAMNHVVAEGEGEPVRMVTLDSLSLRPALIKIDVEGGEEGVFKGGPETIRHAAAILTETETPAIQDQLRAAGFSLRAYDPRARALTGQARGANALYVRDESLVRERVTSAPKRFVYGMTV